MSQQNPLVADAWIARLFAAVEKKFAARRKARLLERRAHRPVVRMRVDPHAPDAARSRQVADGREKPSGDALPAARRRHGRPVDRRIGRTVPRQPRARDEMAVGRLVVKRDGADGANAVAVCQHPVDAAGDIGREQRAVRIGAALPLADAARTQKRLCVLRNADDLVQVSNL